MGWPEYRPTNDGGNVLHGQGLLAAARWFAECKHTTITAWKDVVNDDV